MSPRTALITGANRGIGREIARQLAAAGMTVVIGARDPRLGEEAARAIPGAARAEQLDVTDPGSVEACGRRLAQDGVEIDVLVNNAGLYTTTSLLAIDEERLTEALEVTHVTRLGRDAHGRGRSTDHRRGRRGHGGVAGHAPGRWPDRWLLLPPRADPVVKKARPQP